MGLGQLMIFCESLEKAKKFYVDILGIKIASDMSESDMLIMQNEGSYLTIHSGHKPVDVDRQSCRVVPIFKVLNIIEMKQKLIDHNIEIFGEIQETPVHNYLTLKDFDGNWIEIAEFKSQ